MSAAGSAEPSQSANKGSADPSTTANTKELKTRITVRPLARVRVGGVWVDSDGVLNPKPPPAIKKTSVPQKNRTKIGEKSGKKGCNDPIQLHNRVAPLDDAEMEVEASGSASPRSRSGSPLGKT